MRIAAFLTYYHPHWTGLTAHAQCLAEGLAARGHAVSVVAYRHEPTLAVHERVGGVAVERVPPLARISRGMFNPAYLATAARHVRAAEVVVINTPMLEAWPVARLCRTLGRASVVVHHGDLILPAGIGNRLVEHVTTASMRAAARLADRVTTYSADYGEHSDFLLPFRPRLVTIPPPVTIPVPDRGAAAIWRGALGLSDTAVIGFAGRFVEEKGVDILLRALPLVRARLPHARLLLAAETNVVYERFYARWRPTMEALGDSVVSLGLIRDRQQLADYYALCDVLALPSRSDCFALVQAEAMLCGTPVVASDIPGAREPVRRTGMGRLVRAEDPAALADGLAAVLAAPAAFRRPPAAIAAAFDPAHTFAAYEALFASLGGRARGRTRAASRSATDPAPTVPHATTPAAALPPAQRAALVRRLRYEPDMAYRRRLAALAVYLQLADGDRVLDAGCGTGAGVQALQALAQVAVIGVDRDPARLRRAHAAGVRVVACADVAALPFADASVDKVLCAEVLEHVADDRAALRELFRVLRPGGRLAISVPHADYPWLWDPINRLWAMLGGRPLRGAQPAGIWSLHRRLYWPADLAARVAEAGFAIERVESGTHYGPPCGHFLLYGIGKPLLDHGLLPARWRPYAGRAAPDPADAGGDPFAVPRALLAAIDRWNDAPRVARRRTFVNVLLAAHRPL